MARIAITAAIAVIPVTGASLAVADPAFAAVSKIVCTKLTGTVNLTTNTVKTTLSGCNGHTGGTGTSTGTTTSTKSKVKWANGKVTVFTVHNAAGTFTCPSGDVAEKITGKVTRDTTGSATVGGGVTESVCYNPSTSKLSLAQGTKAKI